MFLYLCEVCVYINVQGLVHVGKCDVALNLSWIELKVKGPPTSNSLTHFIIHRQPTSDSWPCSVLQREMWKIGWWKFRVVKPHCHLFSNEFPDRQLCSQS